ncbi:Trk-type K+ transport system membrane component [Paenarthrobacter sp. TE4293]|uniref:hypothetical protein n=1 Tax=Paenarthrobacter sp. TE4293 TaxID=3381695 RepID=UPI003D243161
MKSPYGTPTTTAFALTDAPDIHLLLMAALIFLAGLAGLGTVTLLLLLAPFAALLMACPGSKRTAQVTTAAATPLQRKEPDGGAARLPPPRAHGKEAA